MRKDISEIEAADIKGTLDTLDLSNDPLRILDFYPLLEGGSVVDIVDLNELPLYFAMLAQHAPIDDILNVKDFITLSALDADKLIPLLRTEHSVFLITPEPKENIFLKPIERPIADRIQASRNSMKQVVENSTPDSFCLNNIDLNTISGLIREGKTVSIKDKTGNVIALIKPLNSTDEGNRNKKIFASILEASFWTDRNNLLLLEPKRKGSSKPNPFAMVEFIR